MIIKPKEERQITILPGQLAPAIDELYNEYVTELYENSELPDILNLIKMFRFCPINRTCVEFKSMRAIESFGQYDHPDKKPIRTSSGIQTLTEWGRGNLKTMKGSFYDSIAKMFRQAYGIGHSVAELIYSANVPGHQGEWRLWEIRVLNPCRYKFAGIGGDWDRIIYYSRQRSHYPIPRRKLLHIYVPSVDDPENPLGDGQGVRGYNYYLARKLALQSWNKQLATGIKGLTVIKADSNATVPKVNSDGKIAKDENGEPIPISAVKQAGKAALEAKDGSVLAIDKSIDVQHFPAISGTGQDYNMALMYYISDIFMAYGIPKTILGEGSGALGQAGLSAGHRLTIDTQIGSMVDITRDLFVELVMRDLLQANFGISQQDDYGSFTAPKDLPSEQAGMRVSNIMSAMLQEIIPTNDLEARNRVRKDLGLTPISTEQFNEMLLQQFLQQQQQSYATQEEQEEQK